MKTKLSNTPIKMLSDNMEKEWRKIKRRIAWHIFKTRMEILFTWIFIFGVAIAVWTIVILWAIKDVF